MALVKGPFFGTYATGSLNKTITVQPLYDGNKFCVHKFKSRSGKRHEIQKRNAEIFKNRADAWNRAKKDGRVD